MAYPSSQWHPSSISGGVTFPIPCIMLSSCILYTCRGLGLRIGASARKRFAKRYFATANSATVLAPWPWCTRVLHVVHVLVQRTCGCRLLESQRELRGWDWYANGGTDGVCKECLETVCFRPDHTIASSKGFRNLV